jgi:hypothetical protein
MLEETLFLPHQMPRSKTVAKDNYASTPLLACPKGKSYSGVRVPSSISALSSDQGDARQHFVDAASSVDNPPQGIAFSLGVRSGFVSVKHILTSAGFSARS